MAASTVGSNLSSSPFFGSGKTGNLLASSFTIFSDAFLLSSGKLSTSGAGISFGATLVGLSFLRPSNKSASDNFASSGAVSFFDGLKNDKPTSVAPNDMPAPLVESFPEDNKNASENI